jgi:arylsulfatase A-like enzyme
MQQGIYFNNYFASSPVCSPSRYNLLTGRYASRCRALLDQYQVSEPAFLRWNVDIDEGERTMAHVMKENGYLTGLVGKYHNMQNEHIQDQIPEDANPNDPEIQQRIAANYSMLKELVQESSGFDYLENVYVNNLHALALPKSMQHHNMDWITEGALNFIEKAGNQPFFLYLATTLPHAHAPVTSMYADAKITPAGLLDEVPEVQPGRMEVIERVKQAGFSEKSAPYTWLDDAVGAVVKRLDREGILENTIILFASDHGGNAAKMTCYQNGVLPLHLLTLTRQLK